MKAKDKLSCSTLSMISYSTGECATSLVLNSFFGFAMLYYTDALGLSFKLAGMAVFVAGAWDAITDPVMGHISDNTRCRFGRRHPYILIGGLVMAVSFFFLWHVPLVFKTNLTVLFWYLVVINLILRTAFTVFVIPYIALGFEMCSDYTGRTKLQGIRQIMSMAANFCGPALAWAIFFPNKEDTAVARYYTNMGSVFSVAVLFFVLFVFFVTLKYMKDSSDIKVTGNNLKGFAVDMKEIITDVNSRWVFSYSLVVILGIAIVSALQMYLYVHFMKFTGIEKTIAHGGSMIGNAIGAYIAASLVQRFDKKGAVYFGIICSVISNGILALLFLPGILGPGQSLSVANTNIPIAFIVFVFLHALYWFGNGIMMPIAMSMMADISEIHEHQTGVNKDAGYAAMYSLSIKLAISVAGLVSGFCLSLIGFVEGVGQIQSPEATWRLCAATLLIGPVISVAALALIRKYPVTKEYIEKIRSQADSQ